MKLRFPTAAVLSVVFLVTMLGPAWAIPDGAPNENRPTLWSPTYMQTQVGYQPWGNVAYYFRWEGDTAPTSMASYAESEFSRPSAEFGWKSTGWSGCRTTESLFGTSGFPSGVYVGVDYTEDAGDAVLFVGDMVTLRPDQRVNPGKLYGAWWGCGPGQFAPADAVFNAAMGSGNRPFNSNTVATLNYVPNEVSASSFPYTHPDPANHHVSHMQLPWLPEGNFETPGR